MEVNQIAWSYSALSSYVNCPHRYYRERVTKDFKPDFNAPHFKWGNDVHTALEHRLRFGKALPANMAQYEEDAARIEAAQFPQGTMHVELEMCLDPQLRPTDWFSKDMSRPSWFRLKADVVLTNQGETLALIGDWKTGKNWGTEGQAKLNAAMAFIWWPTLNAVATQFIFLESGERVDSTFTRDQLPELIGPSLDTVRDVSQSYKTNTWVKRPSYMCRKCQVTDCEFQGK
jgi:hypothetical protein